MARDKDKVCKITITLKDDEELVAMISKSVALEQLGRLEEDFVFLPIGSFILRIEDIKRIEAVDTDGNPVIEEEMYEYENELGYSTSSYTTVRLPTGWKPKKRI